MNIGLHESHPDGSHSQKKHSKVCCVLLWDYLDSTGSSSGCSKDEELYLRCVRIKRQQKGGGVRAIE